MRYCQSRSEALKLTLNGLKPTHRPPSEILAIVFEHCVMEGRVPFDMLTKPRWMGFAAVCSYWRTVALNTPALWTYPHYHHADLARAMIERSRPLPITVEVHISPWTTREVLLALQETCQQASRITHFRLSFCGRTDPKDFLSKHTTRTPAPLLQAMEIHVEKSQRSFKIPDKMWGGKAPNLTHLSLRGCCIDSKSRLLRHLTFLHMDMRKSGRPVNYKEIVGAARHLEHLELYPGGRMRDLDPSNVLHLPHLRHFYVSGDILGCTFLLNQFIPRVDNNPHRDHVREMRLSIPGRPGLHAIPVVDFRYICFPRAKRSYAIEVFARRGPRRGVDASQGMGETIRCHPLRREGHETPSLPQFQSHPYRAPSSVGQRTGRHHLEYILSRHPLPRVSFLKDRQEPSSYSIGDYSPMFRDPFDSYPRNSR